MTTLGVGDGKRLTKEFIGIHAQPMGTDYSLGWGGGWVVGEKRGKWWVSIILSTI